MRSNAPLHARKSCPPGEQVFEMVRGYDEAHARTCHPKAARRPGAALGIEGIPGRITMARDPHKDTNNNLRNQSAHVLVVHFLEHLPAI